MARLGTSLTAILLLAFALVPASDAVTHRRSGCVVGRARVIAVDRAAVVFARGFGQETVGGVYGCSYGHIRYRLGTSETCGKEGCHGISHEVLGASTVAYEWVSTSGQANPEAPNLDFLVVRDLRSNRLIRRVATVAVQSIVVRADGAVAWIAVDPQLSPGERYVVPPCEPVPGGAICRPPHFEPPYVYAYALYEADRTGTRLLAAGVDIEPRSLMLTGSTLRWNQGGKPSFAPLH